MDLGNHRLFIEDPPAAVTAIELRELFPNATGIRMMVRDRLKSMHLVTLDFATAGELTQAKLKGNQTVLHGSRLSCFTVRPPGGNAAGAGVDADGSWDDQLHNGFIASPMFDPARERTVDWHRDIEKDVWTECSKFGVVRRVKVDRKSNEGRVIVTCQSGEDARRIVDGIQGRYFGGKVISCQFVRINIKDY